MMNLNECSYSTGGKHNVCTHPHYCIFNERRWKLEVKLTALLKEYRELKKLKNSYILGYTCNTSYDTIIRKLKLTEESIARLNQFKKKILNEEVDGYGYDGLES